MSPARRVILVVAVLAVATSAVGLGRWQLRRLSARRASNAVLLAAGRLPPLELTKADPGRTPIDSGRRVVAHGSFLPDQQIVLRGRVQNDGPGLQIVTPFVLDSGGEIWVVRGFVASPDAVTPPDTIPAPAAGNVVISGLALGIPVTTDSGVPLLHNGQATWKRLDRATLAARRPGSLPVYLLLSGGVDGPGRLAAVPESKLNDGPHLSYALQWFGIALAVVTFGVIALWRDGRASPQRPEAP